MKKTEPAGLFIWQEGDVVVAEDEDESSGEEEGGGAFPVGGRLPAAGL